MCVCVCVWGGGGGGGGGGGRRKKDAWLYVYKVYILHTLTCINIVDRYDVGKRPS